MKKIIAVAFLLVGMLIGKSEAAGLFEGWQITEVTASSATVFDGTGRVKAVYVTTQVSNATDWTVLIDTPADTPNGTTFASFTSGRKKSPAIYFTSNTVNSGLLTNYKAIDYGEDGIIFSSACFVFKTAASSGEANKVFVEWRK